MSSHISMFALKTHIAGRQ